MINLKYEKQRCVLVSYSHSKNPEVTKILITKMMRTFFRRQGMNGLTLPCLVVLLEIVVWINHTFGNNNDIKEDF